LIYDLNQWLNSNSISFTICRRAFCLALWIFLYTFVAIVQNRSLISFVSSAYPNLYPQSMISHLRYLANDYTCLCVLSCTYLLISFIMSHSLNRWSIVSSATRHINTSIRYLSYSLLQVKIEFLNNNHAKIMVLGGDFKF
jgi:hypothetical protein